MGSSSGKIKRTDDENYRDTQRRWWRLPSFCKRDSSSPRLYDLPLEVLDIILQKSYLLWILNGPANQRDEEIIRSLTSVDVCFYRRITRKRYRRAIWRYLKVVYERNKKHLSICRNNKDFLILNIQPNDEFTDSLFALNCITEEQRQLIQRQHSNRDRNKELLKVVRSFEERKCSDFVNCLRQTNQTTVAKVVENGGVVIKIEVRHSGTTDAESIELLHKRLSDLRDRTKPGSHQSVKVIHQLMEEGIEILDPQLKRQTVVVWIWCRSQTALENIQNLYKSNELRDVFFEDIQPSISKMISIDRNQFKKIVVCTISINLTHRIGMPGDEYVRGVTKLRNEFYVICQLYPTVILVFEDRNPFRLQKKIKIEEIGYPVDIGSSEKENCLYVSDRGRNCVWKITRTRDDILNIIKWLSTDYMPRTLSLSSNGQLLVVSWSFPILWIYGSDAKLIRSIKLPRDMGNPLHAVETSIGNLIIIHEWTEKEERSRWRENAKRWSISELSSDGQMVIRRFIPSYETQELNDPEYLSIDSDDRVFVADSNNGRVIVLHSDLKWNRILPPTNQVPVTEGIRLHWKDRLWYGEVA